MISEVETSNSKVFKTTIVWSLKTIPTFFKKYILLQKKYVLVQKKYVLSWKVYTFMWKYVLSIKVHTSAKKVYFLEKRN